MMISASLLYVHYPKTGGTSVQEYLSRVLPGRYFPKNDASLGNEEKAWLAHQGMAVAFQYAARLGLNPLELPAIACIRNPYSLMLSGYLYLEQKWRDEVGNLEGSFVEYLENLVANTPSDVMQKRAEAPYGPYTGYLTVNGRVPPKLFIARTENLRKDVQSFVQEKLGVSPALGFPHENRTDHEHFSSYYSEKEEEIVYRMWKNAFDSGLYQRYEGLHGLPRHDLRQARYSGDTG